MFHAVLGANPNPDLRIQYSVQLFPMACRKILNPSCHSTLSHCRATVRLTILHDGILYRASLNQLPLLNMEQRHLIHIIDDI